MKAVKYTIHIGILLCLALSSVAYSQNKTQLQNKKKKLQKDINYTQSLIKKNKKNQDASLQQIEKINTSIESREELVNNYTQELQLIAEEMNINQKQVSSLEDQLVTLKKSYSKMVVQAWKTRHTTSTWMFILSAKSFNQAVRRYRYYKQINELRLVQSKSLAYSKNELLSKIGQLRNSKVEKELTINEKNNELKMLESEKKEKDEVLKKLKKKEKELLAQVKKQEKERDALASKINSIIEKLPSVKKKETKTNSNSKNSNTKTTNTKTEVTNTQGSSNSNGFESNKGKLSWPVTKGVITGKYGVHQHPVLDKVEVKNDGINISTDPGGAVRAVYKGTISGIFKVDGYENVVIIRHGDYLTVYSHLSQVSVSKGNDVGTEQKIGTAATNSEGETYINFQVRYGSATQNPTSWLIK